MKFETHLFIIWENARKEKEKLFTEIEKKFVINDVYEVIWTPKNFAKNLKRFYGVTLPNPEKKVEQCGNGPFLLVLVTDTNPKHGLRGTSMGKQIVNTNVYDLKRKIRKMIQSEYPIHGSIHEKEANHDITLILGKNFEQVNENISKKWNGEIKSINCDIIGTEKWNSLEQIFFVLNNTMNYVILRNFENFPDYSDIIDGGDIDILTDDLWQIPYILNFQKKIKNNLPGFRHVKINSDYIKFDVRYVGDSYIDEKWSRDILEEREMTKGGFYTPNKEHYFYSLLYHIIVQKSGLPDKYKEKLKRLSSELNIEFSEDVEILEHVLNEYMKKHGYRYTNSLFYKINHNELTRLLGVAIHTTKKEGINELLRATKGKIKRTIKN